jgi:hypothetical protein
LGRDLNRTVCLNNHLRQIPSRTGLSSPWHGLEQ